MRGCAPRTREGYDEPEIAPRMPARLDPSARPDIGPDAGPDVGRARAWILPALILLLLCVRGLSVLGLADVFYYGEEMARGTAAKAIVDALPVPHYKIGHWYFEGGSFTVAHITALLFLLLGPCLLAHKLAALLINGLILWAGFALTRRNFGARTATVFGLLVVFAPESFQRLSYLNLGNHFAATLFLALILGLAFRIAFDKDSRVTTYAWLGLVSGFAFYFSYQCLPAIAFAGGLVLVLRWRDLSLSKVLVTLCALGLGLAPFLWMWSQAGREVFRVHDGYLFQSAPRDASGAGGFDFLTSLYAGRSVWDQAHIALLQLTPLAGLVLFLAQRGRYAAREPQRYAALFAYLVFFTAVYLKSGFAVGKFYHFFTVNRMSPYWLIGTVLCAATVVHLVTSRKRVERTLGFLLGGFLLVAGVRDAVRVWSETRFESLSANVETLLHTKGYSYADYLPYFRRHLDGPLVDDLRIALSFDEPCRPWLVAETVQSLITTDDLSPKQLTQLFEKLDRQHWRDYLPGLGPYLFARGGRQLEGALDEIAREPDSERRWMLAALGLSGPGSYRSTANARVPPGLEGEIQIVLPRLGPVERTFYFHGVGHRLQRTFQLYPREAYAAIERQPPEIQDALRNGYDEARAWHQLP